MDFARILYKIFTTLGSRHYYVTNSYKTCCIHKPHRTYPLLFLKCLTNETVTITTLKNYMIKINILRNNNTDYQDNSY